MNTKLHELKERHGLTLREIAKLCYVTEDTVRSWSSGRNRMSDGYLKLLEIQLERAKQ